MQELSMNVLDIAENSVRANATLIEIDIVQCTKENKQTITIKDNGKGMSADMVSKVCDPFTTTRTTRKVGLGVPFFKMAAQQTGGSFSIESEVGVGTTVTATFTLGHIDLMPLGEIEATVATLVQGAPDIDFVYSFKKDDAVFSFDTREARVILDGVSLAEPAVYVFIKDHIKEGMEEITK